MHTRRPASCATRPIVCSRAAFDAKVVTSTRPFGHDGARWSFTPDLGIFHATTDAAGNIMVSEDRIRYAYETAAGNPLLVINELSLALGEAWDEELEPFRHAAEGAPVRWLHQVG